MSLRIDLVGILGAIGATLLGVFQFFARRGCLCANLCAGIAMVVRHVRWAVWLNVEDLRWRRKVEDVHVEGFT